MYYKKHVTLTDNPPIRIYINRKLCLKLNQDIGHLTHETMNLVTSTENKIAKDKNGENMPHLETTEII